MGDKISRMVVVTHGVPKVAADVVAETLVFCRERGVEVVGAPGESDKHFALGSSSSKEGGRRSLDTLDGVDLCLVLGGDGTMLRAFHLTRGHEVPVAGVNLGRVGFLTTIDRDHLRDGLDKLIGGDYQTYPLLGLEARHKSGVYGATNDVVVHRGDRPTACALGLKINGVALFEVGCDGVVAATPAGSSAYSLAAGGPLLGVSLEAYVISLVAAHAVGVRPVVAASKDVLEISNVGDNDCHLDIDGQRSGALRPGDVVSVRTVPAATSLALLEGDSLYKHFRDRLL